MSDLELCRLPFFCWEILTINFKHTTLDIVIKDQNTMDVLLKFLIHELNTIDGTRDSAQKIKEELFERNLKKFSGADTKSRD